MNYKTLSRYVECKKKHGSLDQQSFGYKQTRLVFSKELEKQLVEYLITASNIFHGLTITELRELAFELAEANELKMPKTWTEIRLAGIEWARGFMKRHGDEISMRTPEATSLQRMSSFNKHNLELFYNNLEKAMEKGFTCDRIWNVDETGVTTVQKPVKQIAKKGEKRVGAIAAQECGTLVTVCCSINAAGNHIPPFLVFPRVNAQDHWRLTLPPGAAVEGHPKASGWMTQENFISFLKHFTKYTKPTSESPVLLLLDNHKSHISLKAVNYCRENHITLLSFPPHCSHEVQPLDKCVYGPFKTFCNQASDRWCHDPLNAGKPMTIHTIPSVVNYGFVHAFNQKNILSAFRSTGIYPFDRNAIPEDRFLPSYTTDRPLPESSANNTGPDSAEHHSTSVQLPSGSGAPAGVTNQSVSPFAIRPFGKAAPAKH